METHVRCFRERRVRDDRNRPNGDLLVPRDNSVACFVISRSEIAACGLHRIFRSCYTALSPERVPTLFGIDTVTTSPPRLPPDASGSTAIRRNNPHRCPRKSGGKQEIGDREVVAVQRFAAFEYSAATNSATGPVNEIKQSLLTLKRSAAEVREPPKIALTLQ